MQQLRTRASTCLVDAIGSVGRSCIAQSEEYCSS
jgi:hypothetical protein